MVLCVSLRGRRASGIDLAACGKTIRGHRSQCNEVSMLQAVYKCPQTVCRDTFQGTPVESLRWRPEESEVAAS